MTHPLAEKLRKFADPACKDMYPEDIEGFQKAAAELDRQAEEIAALKEQVRFYKEAWETTLRNGKERIRALETAEKEMRERLGELQQTATMLETYAPEVFPEVNELGQVHFGRAMMESAAAAIRALPLTTEG